MKMWTKKKYEEKVDRKKSEKFAFSKKVKTHRVLFTIISQFKFDFSPLSMLKGQFHLHIR